MKRIYMLRYSLTYLNKFLSLKTFVLTLMFACCMSTSGYAQSGVRNVSGKVIDANNESMPGVNVSIKGVFRGVSTDVDGNYVLVGVSTKDILVFSFVGTQTQEVLVGQKEVINIVLKNSTVNLDEIVAIGFGTSKKQNLTGSIETVSSKVLESRPVTSVGQALQGVIPGLVVSRSSAGGKPGVALSMNIRGGGNPYVLIDGVKGSMSDLNPDDIATITVLKDAASAAIYGAKAAYGVILITTKEGKKGVRVNYSNNFSFSAPLKLPKQANSYAYAKFFNAASVNGGGMPLVSIEVLEKLKRYINEGDIDGTSPNPMDPTKWANTEYANANTDWFDFHFKDWALQETHNLSISGSSDKTDYYISGSKLDQEGIIAHGNDNFSKKTINSKVNSKLYDWLSVSSNMRYSSREVDMPSFLNMNGNMIHRIAQSRWPSNPIKDPNGHYTRVSDVAAIEEGGRTNDLNTNFSASLGLKYEPIKDWVTEFSYDWNNSTWQQKLNENTEFTYYGVGEREFMYGDNKNSKYSTYTGVKEYSSPKVFSTYKKSVENHNFKIMVGFQQTLSEYSKHSVSRKELQTPLVPSIGTANGEITGGEQKGHYATKSYFGRFNYDYKEKYLLEVNWRADGSSYFKKGKRWGSFPSFSAGYNIAKEYFWKPIENYINQFKFRTSYGSLGNQSSFGYRYLESYHIMSNYPWIMGGNTKPNVVYMPAVPSPDLTWETVSMLTFGFDGGFLNNRLTTTFDWYKRDRTDILGPSTTPPATYGGNVPLTNNVEIETKGWEVSVAWEDKVGDFSYNLRATLTDYKSIYKKYNNPTKYLWTPSEGTEIGDVWGYTSNGLFQSEQEIEDAPDLSAISSDKWYPGDVRYEDINGDGKIDYGKTTLDDHGDLSIIGNNMPKFQYGFTAACSWKNFEFSMFWQGVGKQDAWLGGNFFFGSANSRWQSTCLEGHVDYWTKDNTDAYYARPYLTQAGVDKNQKVSTRYLQDASYLRLKNIQLGYTLPSSLTNKVKVKKMKVYVSAENILTITNLNEAYDPEGLNGFNGTSSGKTYPIQKSVSFGLNVVF